MEGGSLFLVKGEFNGFKSFKRIESIKESRYNNNRTSESEVISSESWIVF